MRAFVIKTYPAKKINPRLGREPLGGLAIEVVSGIFAKKGYEAVQLRVQIMSREPFVSDLDLAKLQTTEGDIFAFSCHVGNITDSVSLAEDLGRNCPESILLMGGPHFNKFVAETILKDHPRINYVLTGLAESNLIPFLEALKDGQFSKVDGLYYCKDGELRSSQVERPSFSVERDK